MIDYDRECDTPSLGAAILAARVSRATADVVAGGEWPTETQSTFRTDDGRLVTCGVIWGEYSKGVAWEDGDRWWWQLAGNEQDRLLAESREHGIDAHLVLLVERYEASFVGISADIDRV